jgi:hypothetical protein
MATSAISIMNVCTGEHAILITVLQAVAAAHIAAFKRAAAATAVQ